MNYELGLERLKQLVPDNTDQYDDFLAYEQQLRENLRDERRYGSNEQKRSDRARIIEQLNHLAKQVGTRNFNDLCQPGNPSNLQTSPKAADASALPQLPNIKPNPQRTRAYISFSSFSEHDKSYLNELHTALNQLKGKGLDYWDRDIMMAGADQSNTVTAALNSTRVAILLISSDFLAAGPTDFITTHELPALLAAAKKEEVALFIVIVRPCTFELSELNSLQPVNTRPLSSVGRHEREEFWGQIARDVFSVLR